jgi:hypothetical protein
MTLDECFNKLLQMSDEGIKYLEKHSKIAELSKDFSTPKVNNSFQEELERIWQQPGYVETCVPNTENTITNYEHKNIKVKDCK